MSIQSVDSEAAHRVARDVATVGRIRAVESMLEVLCRTTGLRFAAVARVTGDRWTACAVRDEIGMGIAVGGELPILTTLCHQVHQSKMAVVIDDVKNDPQYRDHPTPKMFGFQSYISMPILRRQGEFFGTLCALDPLPAALAEPKTIAMFEAFSQTIGLQLEAEELLQSREAQLLDEKQTAELREQFIAVIGHDLRNPISATINSANLLLQMPLSDKALRYSRYIQESGQRMSELVSNLLDFARGRLGGGFALNRQAQADLGRVLHRIVSELLACDPARQLEVDIRIDRPVVCDVLRIGQIFSNLLSNALVHGAKNAPVTVRAECFDENLLLAVSNGGPAIPAEKLNRLFQPFSRASGARPDDGLGLGLFIAFELAKAHGGTLTVESGSEQTTFEMRIPVLD